MRVALTPTGITAAEPAGRAAFHAFLAGVRFQRSELDWRPRTCQVVASPARGQAANRGRIRRSHSRPRRPP